jgi:mannose/fructose/N-acetylgalactosamine-specific phosphotransferase system component IIC
MKRRLAVVVVLTGMMLLAAHLTALAASSIGAPAAQDTGRRLGFIQAVLIAFGYFLTNSAFTPNIGFNLLRWPLAAGPIVGLIMGDVPAGITYGASINLVYLGVIAAGGSQPADPSLAGWLGTALAIAVRAQPQEAIAIAAPLGVIGLIGFFSRMNVDVVFVRWADERAEKGDIDGVARMNWVPGQIYVFLSTFIPVLILALVGEFALNALFDAIDPFRGGSADWRWVRDWFIVGGSVLTAVGIGLNLNLILRGSTIPYFLVGFTISALTGINLIAMAVLAGALAILHIMFTRRQNVPAA